MQASFTKEELEAMDVRNARYAERMAAEQDEIIADIAAMDVEGEENGFGVNELSPEEWDEIISGIANCIDDPVGEP